MTFVVWFFLFDGLIMFPIFAMARRGQIIALLAAEGWHGIAAGLFSLISFGAALIALRLAPVPVVSALRETSVVFAMMLAAITFKEEIGPRRMIGALLSFVGAVLVIFRPI
jgi:drug/metabolite transporter (DMT)-like permease